MWESVLFPTVLPKSLLFSFYIFVSLIGETSNFVLLLNLLVSLRVHFSQFYLFFFFFSEALFIFGRLAFSVRTVFRLTVPSSLQSQFSMPSLTPRGLDQSVQWLGVRGRTKTAPLQPWPSLVPVWRQHWEEICERKIDTSFSVTTPDKLAILFHVGCYIFSIEQ